MPQSPLFALNDGILTMLRLRKRCVVTKHLRERKNHSGPLSGHFAGEQLNKMPSQHRWWDGMYRDTVKHCSACPGCANVKSFGQINHPSFQCRSHSKLK